MQMQYCRLFNAQLSVNHNVITNVLPGNVSSIGSPTNDVSSSLMVNLVNGSLFLEGIMDKLCCLLWFLKSLARDRLERLNGSPSATPWAYFRVSSVLLLVLSIDIFWALGSNILLLLFFEPFSMAFETAQAIMVHGFQFLELWHRHSLDSSADCGGYLQFDRSAVGSFWEWKGILLRNLGFILDLLTLLTALGHYLYIWWLHGMAFHLVDAVLFLTFRALVSAIYKRIRGFFKLRRALSRLHGALPDASIDELRAYNDECAICRTYQPRKVHSCNESIYESLRAVDAENKLDQGLNEVYSCPTCRRPLFVGSNADRATSRVGDLLDDEQLARQISSGLDQQSIGGQALPVGQFTNQQQNPSDRTAWRGVDQSWVHPWPGAGLDGAGPSTTMRSVGFGRVQMMMRHLTSVGETYAHSALEDSAWSLWPMTHPQGPSSSTIPPAPSAIRYDGNMGGLHFRNNAPSGGGNLAGVLAMAETVREVLPHIPDEMIIQVSLVRVTELV
ncbi:hypothetical protein ACLOJK_005525 [Asimina triloba]